MAKSQRVRDPVHDLIEFAGDPLGETLWNVVKSRPFQRLRRIRQLGFSEFVFPGATHSRFAHSLGVYHTSKILMRIIERHLGPSAYDPDKANQAIAAALVHDLGHGPFSHAFEKVGKQFGWESAEHEKLSVKLIRASEVSDALSSRGSGFADDVAKILQSTNDIYGSVVSSQFDADRLDYMRRDRLMTGTQHAAIDFPWLIDNLEIGEVPFGEDETQAGSIETLVLGQKAVHAAETYVLSLFQLYPTVYFHKATRSAEVMFAEALARALQLAIDGSLDALGLPETHPLVRFARDPENVERVMELDDTVIWGALSMMAEGKDKPVSEFATRIRDRQLYKAIDVRIWAAARGNEKKLPDDERRIFIDRTHVSTKVRIQEALMEDDALRARILIDEGSRSPYKRLSESKGPLNQIQIRVEGGSNVDLGERSRVVKAIQPFKFLRLYVAEDDTDARSLVETVIREEMEKHDAE